MKTEVLSIKEFLHGKEKQPISVKIEQHFKKYGSVYKNIGKVAGLTLIIISAPNIVVFASSGIDVEAGKLYKELVGIGRWVIIFKGGIDIIKKIGNEDMEGTKKTFISHLLIYLLLLGLPYGLDKVDHVFSAVSSNK